MAIYQVEYADEQDILSAKQHGAEWAGTVEPKQLRRLQWMHKVWGQEKLRRLHPLSFACAVNPDRAKDTESAEELWEEMTGFPVKSWDQSKILLAFVDGALPVARERVRDIDARDRIGDIEIEPVIDPEDEYDFTIFDEGLALGREWAAKRADSSVIKYLTTLQCVFGDYVRALLHIADFDPDLLIRSLVFMIRPNDVTAPCREIWLQTVGTEASDPWDGRFVRGFVSGTLAAVAPPPEPLKLT